MTSPLAPHPSEYEHQTGFKRHAKYKTLLQVYPSVSTRKYTYMKVNSQSLRHELKSKYRTCVFREVVDIVCFVHVHNLLLMKSVVRMYLYMYGVCTCTISTVSFGGKWGWSI